MSQPVPADPTLAALLAKAAVQQVGGDDVLVGSNATADSFYSSQGRTGSHFDDFNDGLIERLTEEQPELLTLEMETFQLLDLARCSRGAVRGAAFAICLAQRYDNA